MQTRIKETVTGVVFFLGLLLLIILASKIFQPKDNMKSTGMEDMTANAIMAEPENTIDVLFLGDSVSYCSIIPMQIWRDYGITSYVCGTPLQELYYSKEFLEKTFKTQSPKVVMLEMTPLFNKFEAKDEIKNKVERLLPIFRYHDRWKEPASLFANGLNLELNYTYLDICKGYRYGMAIEPIDPGNYTAWSEAVAEIPDECMDALLEIKAYCEERGAELILMGVPNTLGWDPARYNATMYLTQELDLKYFDMNYLQEEVAINWQTDSFDYGEHLNYLGAEKVTAYVGQYLDDLNIFEDKREVKAYEAWNQTQKEFYEFIGR